MKPVIVLCGGKGERLRSAIDDRPKVLATVNGVAFLSFVLERLVREGAESIYLSTGYRAEMIEEYVSSRQDWGAAIHCIAESAPLGTAGAIRLVSDSASLSDFFVLNGDTWFDGSLQRLEDFHADHGARASVALVAVEDGSRYGQVRFDEDSAELIEFAEKGQMKGPAWINAGMYILSAEILDAVPAAQPCSLEREIFPALVGQGLYALPYEDATFLDIGTPEDLSRAGELMS